MTLIAFMLMTMAVMKFWPETRSACWLHRHMVAFPLEWAEQASRRHLLAALIMVALLIGSMGEIAVVAPGDLLFLYSLDLATYVEVYVTLWTVAAVASARGAGRAVLARLPLRRGLRLGGRARRRSKAPMAQRKPSNDDEEGDGAVFVPARAA